MLKKRDMIIADTWRRWDTNLWTQRISKCGSQSQQDKYIEWRSLTIDKWDKKGEKEVSEFCLKNMLWWSILLNKESIRG